MSMPRAEGKRGESRLALVAWLGLVAALLLLAAYLASHRSEHPVFLGRYSSGYMAMLAGLLLVAAGMTLIVLPRFRSRSAVARANLLLVIASTFMVAGVAELAVRLADPVGISYYEHSRRYQLDMLPDATRGFRHRSGFAADYGATSARFNELGLRDDPVTPGSDEELRILAVGDSMTFGWGVPQEDGFTEQLQRKLAAWLGRPVNVINGGVGGYNSSQELAFLLEDGLRLAPDLVLLTYVSNDIETFTGPFVPHDLVALADKAPADALRLLLGRLWLYRLVNHVLVYGGNKGQILASEFSGGPDRWAESMAAVREMTAATRRAGVPLVVVFFRWTDAGNPALLALFEELRAAVAPAPVLDTAAWFAGHDLRALMNSRVDSHPNRDGNALLAEGVATYVVSSGPGTHRPVP